MNTPPTNLAIYLNDHLAGSVAALGILEELQRGPDREPLRSFVSQLQAAIAEDRDELEALMHRAGVTPSATRRAAAWIGKKFAALKVRVDDPADGSLRSFELLEVLALGIDGKRALWTALRTVAEDVPALQGVDYGRLSQRADAQRAAVEARRLERARTALGAQQPVKHGALSSSPSGGRSASS